MKYGDVFIAVLGSKKITGNDTLLIITAAHAKYVGTAFLGQLRVGRCRGDLQYVLLFVYLGRRNRGARAKVAGDEYHALAGKLVGDRHGLLRVARVVSDGKLELLAEDATGGVNVLDRHFGATPHLLPERGVLARHRTGGGNENFGHCTRRPE